MPQRHLLLVLLTLALSLSFSIPAEHNQNDIAQRRRETRERWAKTGVDFPCPDALKQHQGKLPPLVINGESHGEEYCEMRRGILGQHLERGEVCLALEEYSADAEVVKGLSHAGVQELASLFVAYELAVLQSKSPLASGDKDLVSFARMTATHAIFQSAKAREALTKVALSKCGPKSEKCAKIGEAIALIELARQKDPGRSLDREFSGLGDVLTQNPEVLVEVLPSAIRVLASELEKESAGGGGLNAKLAPSDLLSEIEHYIKTIDRSAETPGDPVCSKQKGDCFKYLTVQWRSVLMAERLARLYCEAIQAGKFLPIHAVVGQGHTAQMEGMLRASARTHGVPMPPPVDGVALGKLYQIVRGEENEGYRDQKPRKEYFNNLPVGYSQQTGGVRVMLLEHFPDELGGTVLNSENAARGDGKGIVYLFGPEDKYQAFLRSLKVPVGQEPTREQYLELGRKLRESVESIQR